jgi:hypothetical protein
MTKKTINISTKPIPRDKIKEIDEWVIGGEGEKGAPAKYLVTKKITLSIPEDLHKKIKLYCVQNNLKIKNKIIEIITKAFQ